MKKLNDNWMKGSIHWINNCNKRIIINKTIRNKKNDIWYDRLPTYFLKFFFFTWNLSLLLLLFHKTISDFYLQNT